MIYACRKIILIHMHTTRNVSSSFFIARISVRVAGAAARDLAATLHGLRSHPSFRLGKVPSDFIQDPQCNWSI